MGGALLNWMSTTLFCHDNLVEEVYMALPPGLHHEGESFSPNTVCKLHKGFTPSTADNSLFIKSSGNSFIALLDLERLKYFLGLEVARSSRISLRYRLSCPQNQKTPMDPNLKLSQEEGDLLEDHFMYKWLIGNRYTLL
ncbi:hypothetical protein CK203_040170 [Vitis vinifera]|uniref:Uncharacterized protein n=1 Tax=Vitis vinifera TaxID=29760 RepID=A0A438H3E5_VITVI|nr:hypothetical protein CK203_040170 [Vitis vinifera]